MKKIYVSMEKETVTENFETCSFHEAGIQEKPFNRDDIEEHLMYKHEIEQDAKVEFNDGDENYREECEIIFVDDDFKPVDSMSIEEIKDFLDDVNWTQIHKLSALGNYGDQINVFSDGSIDVLGQGTTYRDYSYVVCSINAIGRGNLDTSDYLEGWGKTSEDGEFFLTNDGRKITIDEAIQECIEEGEWTEWVEYEKRNTIEAIEDERRNEKM